MDRVMTSERTTVQHTTNRTSQLLACGAIAGPLFTVVGLVQAFTRQGFDLRRHALSVLENGNLGWIQIGSFFVSGVLFVLGAVGMRRILRGSRGGTWGPTLIAIAGLGLVGAAFFHADPGLGFPPGTPQNVMTLSGQGMGHLLVSTVAFLTMIAACFVFARRFMDQRQRGWAFYSMASGVLSFVTLAVLSTGHLWMNIAFVFAMLNLLLWVSVMAAKLLIERSPASA
jgi:hypothetical protein